MLIQALEGGNAHLIMMSPECWRGISPSNQNFIYKIAEEEGVDGVNAICILCMTNNNQRCPKHFQPKKGWKTSIREKIPRDNL